MSAPNQLARMAQHMDAEHSRLRLANSITLDGERVTITKDSFRPIPHTEDPAAAAYVDGGNAMIFRSPVFVATLNRTYCSVFRGSARLDMSVPPRTQFLTLMHNMPQNGRVGQSFAVFAEGDGDNDCIPSTDNIKGAADAAEPGGGKEHRIHSLSRELSEWLMAAAAARVMEGGGLVVKDGSLSAWGNIEETLMLNAFAVARERGVVMCGLSKTTNMLMDSGRPLVNHMMDRGPDGSWYVPLGDVWNGSDDCTGKTGKFVVKLHPRSKYVYRLDIPSAVLALIDRAGTERVMSSLAANSGDAHIPGYPYGLLDADRFAQVRNGEAARYGSHLLTHLSPDVRNGMHMQGQHGIMNGVAS